MTVFSCPVVTPYKARYPIATLSEFDKQAAIREQAIADRAVAVGGFGGGREGVLSSEYQTQSDRNRAQLQAQLQAQGFSQAQAARQADLQNQMMLSQGQLGLGAATSGLAQQQAQLGLNQLGLGQAQLGLGQFQTGLAAQVPTLQRADISTLGQVGAAQQAQRQAELDATRQGARTAAYEPLERLGFFGQGVTGLMGGYPAQYQFSQTPPASPFVDNWEVSPIPILFVPEIEPALGSEFTVMDVDELAELHVLPSVTVNK